MSQAEDLLSSSTSSNIATLSADSSTEEHIIVGADRFITVPDSLKRIAVQFDHNIETVTFDCPRYWDGYDMSKMKVCINYERSDGYKKSYTCKKVTPDENDPNIMHFDWTILRDVTLVEGSLIILVCIKKTNTIGVEENHWNSERNNELYVSKGMEVETTADTSINMIQGDTFSAVVGIYDDQGNVYTPEQNDAIIFTVKKSLTDETPMLLKNIPIDTMKLVINASDTVDIALGNYVYDIRLTKETGEVYTIISNSSFVLAQEVN